MTHKWQLAEAQKRTEARLDSLAARVEELAQAQARTEARLAQLADAQRRTEQRLDAFEQRTEEHFQRIDADLKDLKDSVSVLKGHDLERTYRDRAAGYFGRLFKGLRVLPDYEVDRLLEAAVTQGIITWEERDDVLESDLVARGQLRSTNQTAFLVVEISWGVGPEDVERAHRRAATLQKVTGAAIAAVAGVSILPQAKELSDTLGVTRVTDGSVEGPGITG
ncbi:MAG: hypothetical protein IMX01_07345 [Limnochordaceae bacterium]|nr:hypothetical protein [Limnochordaceae bacterium]